MTDWLTSRRSLLKGSLAGILAMKAGEAALSPVAAQQGRHLRIGMFSPNTTMDPHLANNGPNNAVSLHVFDSLVSLDENLQSKPGLALDWRVVDETHWEFTLRPGVKFSDGAPLTVEDIAASFKRADTLPSTTPYRTYTRNIKAITASGADKVVIETARPDPLLPNSVARIRIIRATFKDADSAEFNAGKAAIGTGPYMLKEFVPGTSVALVPNPNYWGPKQVWSAVTLRMITDGGARLAAVLSGDVDIIEQVLYESLPIIKNNPRVKIISGPSSRIAYLALDSEREVTPFITDLDGKPLPKNPLKDRRVRLALSMAINRQAIIDRVLEGNAILASQILPPGSPGTSTKVRSPAYDPEKARALLAEAGYPKGFGLTIHGPYNRIVNDSKIVQAVAQMFKRIGIDTKVEVMPWSVYSTKNNLNTFSVSLNSYGVTTGEMSNPMTGMLATHDAAKGMGSNNQGRYSNPAFDARLAEASRTLDEARRNTILAECSEILAEDVAFLPLHHEVLVLAARKDIEFATRKDQYTLAQSVKSAS